MKDKKMFPHIDEQTFFIKILGIGIAIGIIVIYILFRVVTGRNRHLISGQHDEYKLIKNKKGSVEKFQTGPWVSNLNFTITFSAFSLNSIILAVIVIFEQHLTGYDAIIFDIVLAFSGLSVIPFFLSVQYWFLALDIGGAPEYRVKFRRYATILQSVGWVSLLCEILVSILIINTYLGYLFCILTVVGLIFIFEHKAKMSLDEEERNAGKNEFQKEIKRDEVYIKNYLENRTPGFIQDKLKILSWNIERGYQPDLIADTIQRINPDIVCLQEVDWCNKRTNSLDVLDYLAKKNHLFGLFSTEFYELDTPYRSKRLAGGGVHGNAILSKIAPEDYFSLRLPKCYNWKKPARKRIGANPHEKRSGNRIALFARYNFSGDMVTVCSAHLEDKDGGVAGRVKQYKSIVDKLRKENLLKEKSIIAGDFNTFDDWLTRFLQFSDKKQAKGKKGSISEANWWKSEFLPSVNFMDPFREIDWTHRITPFIKFKLDWITLSNCIVIEFGVENIDISDHRPLWVSILK